MEQSDWVARCVDAKRLLTQFPASWSERERISARREALAQLAGFDIGKIPENISVLEKAQGKNIENPVGVVSVPLGVAGPLKIKNEKLRIKDVFLPLATTEGALVASINRGCKAIRESGGAEVFVEEVGITRGPVFRALGIRQARQFTEWLGREKKELRQVAEGTSRHLKLIDFKTRIVGRNVFVRFRFDTGEAMGMNMATIATQAMVDFVESNFNVSCVAISGNFCVDKKPAQLNFIMGRGKQVWAEVLLSPTVVKAVLKTSVRKLVEVFYRKILVGSAASGSMGYNGHFANVVASLFLATGQDMAQVVEGAAGIATAEEEKGGVRISVFMPSLILGTVGGGTHLPQQSAALEMMGLGKGEAGEARAFAEIVGGAALAGEISLAASLAQGSLAQAHQRLGRGKRV